jgi:hypothetical protein
MSARPIRVQLRRTKGWRLPPNTVSVARPGKWGNPYKAGRDGTAGECVRKYREYLQPFRHGDTIDVFYLSESNVRAVQNDLAGKNLACWCPLDQPCHADVLLELANAEVKS